MLGGCRKPAHTHRAVSRRHGCIIAHPTDLLACATAPSLKPTPTTTRAASPQHHPPLFPCAIIQSLPLSQPVYPHPLSRRTRPLTSAIHPPAQRSSPRASTNRPRHRPISIAFCDRPTRRAAQPIASRQLRDRCAGPPETETDTRAWLCFTHFSTASLFRSMRSDPRVHSA